MSLFDPRVLKYAFALYEVILICVNFVTSEELTGGQLETPQHTVLDFDKITIVMAILSNSGASPSSYQADQR